MKTSLSGSKSRVGKRLDVAFFVLEEHKDCQNFVLKSPLNQPKKSNRPNGPQMPRRTRKMPYGEGCPRQWRRKLRRQGRREAMDEMMEYTKSSKKSRG